MKDEIKEIQINKPNKSIMVVNNRGVFVQFGVAYEILDLITNLQEENNNLKEDFKRHIDRINELTEKSDNLQEENQRLKDSISAMEHNYKLLTKLIENGESITKKFENGLIYQDYKSRNEKALDKLYCYGEVFDSKILQQFQKEMENILNGGDDNE